MYRLYLVKKTFKCSKYVGVTYSVIIVVFYRYIAHWMQQLHIQKLPILELILRFFSKIQCVRRVAVGSDVHERRYRSDSF
jgi:hypothetical protein